MLRVKFFVFKPCKGGSGSHRGSDEEYSAPPGLRIISDLVTLAVGLG